MAGSASEPGVVLLDRSLACIVPSEAQPGPVEVTINYNIIIPRNNDRPSSTNRRPAFYSTGADYFRCVDPDYLKLRPLAVVDTHLGER